MLYFCAPNPTRTVDGLSEFVFSQFFPCVTLQDNTEGDFQEMGIRLAQEAPENEL